MLNFKTKYGSNYFIIGAMIVGNLFGSNLGKGQVNSDSSIKVLRHESRKLALEQRFFPCDSSKLVGKIISSVYVPAKSWIQIMGTFPQDNRETLPNYDDSATALWCNRKNYHRIHVVSDQETLKCYVTDPKAELHFGAGNPLYNIEGLCFKAPIIRDTLDRGTFRKRMRELGVKN